MSNTDTTQTNRRPNYRLYDCTGGGVTEDIYAASLEDAIKQGRDWIEGGDWSGSRDEDAGEGRVYRIGIPLDCEVREIVRFPAAPGEGQSLDEDGDLLDAEGYLICAQSDLGEIDEDATAAGDAHDCSGEYSDTLPDCEQRDVEDGKDDEADDEGHVWRSPHRLVGGCKENPGVWGGSGTSMSFEEVCRRCGCRKHTRHAGSQRNEGEPRETITIKDRDEATAAWLKRTHEEDGFLPGWLAEMLDCTETVRMTEAQARDYVASHTDEDDLDDEDLEHVFAALTGRRASDDDRREGLWSHICAECEESV